MANKSRVTIVAGFLGAGKTSLLCHLIDSTDPESTVSVLINEIGKIGVDAELVERFNGKLEKRQLVGGCICCTALPTFRHTLIKQLSTSPNHLFIEPSGVAGVGSILTILAEPEIASKISIDPVLVVMDPRQWDKDHISMSSLYQEQSDNADIIIMSHSDLCHPRLLSHFKKNFKNTPLITANKGVLEKPLNVEDKSKPATLPFNLGPTNPTVTAFYNDEITWSLNQMIDLKMIEKVFSDNPPPDTVLRCKGIVLSDKGWVVIQYSDSNIQIEQVKEVENSFLVIIAWEDSYAEDWWQSIKNKLELCVIPMN
jgi:G3E family GTPase